MIVLIRHATPVIHYAAQTSAQARVQQQQYDGDCDIVLSEIDKFMMSPMYDVMKKKRFYLLASPLSRSLKTCNELFEGKPTITGNLAEAQTYIPAIPFISLPFRWWAAIGRLLWLMNLAPKNIESKKAFLYRIRNACKEAHSTEGNLCIVAHGIVNYAIKRYHLRHENYAVTHRFQSGCFTVEYLEKVVYL